MDALNFIGQVVLGGVATWFAILIGSYLVQYRNDKDSIRIHEITPVWLVIIDICFVIVISYFISNKISWSNCGTWLIGGLILGYLQEFFIRKVAPKDIAPIWIKKAAKESCRKYTHEWGEWLQSNNICFKDRTCKLCGMEERKKSGKHAWDEWKPGEKSCQQERVCANCGQEEKKYNHDFKIVDEWIDHSQMEKFPNGRPSGKYLQIRHLKCKHCGYGKKEEQYTYVSTPDPW